MIINIFDYSEKKHVSEESIQKIVEHVLKTEKTNISTINIVITNDGYMNDLNKRFLNKDRPTNVIAFKMDEVSEIYVSHEQAKTNSEVYYFIIHGLLHLSGYDHDSKKEERKMDTRCRKYLQDVLPDQVL